MCAAWGSPTLCVAAQGLPQQGCCYKSAAVGPALGGLGDRPWRADEPGREGMGVALSSQAPGKTDDQLSYRLPSGLHGEVGRQPDEAQPPQVP